MNKEAAQKRLLHAAENVLAYADIYSKIDLRRAINDVKASEQKAPRAPRKKQ